MMQDIFIFAPKATPGMLKTQGEGGLNCTAAEVLEEINGEYSCQIETYQEIQTDQIVRLNGDYFRLDKPVKEMQPTGALKYTATGWHISYDLINDLILDRRWIDSGAAEAVAGIVQAGIYDRRFTGSSDIYGPESLAIVRLNPIAALIGDQDNSFINRWGGEIYRHHFDIAMLQRRGKVTARTIRYGSDLTGLTITEEGDRIINRLVPTYLSAPNVASLLPEKYIDSPRISDTAVPHAATVHFGDIEVGKEEEGQVPYPDKATAEAEVRRRVSDMYTAGLDRPKVTAKVSFVELAETDEGKRLRDELQLERLELGDTVKVRYKGWLITQRVMAYKLDALTGRYLELTLGSPELSLSSTVHSLATSAARSTGEEVIERVTPLIEGQVQLNAAVAGSLGLNVTPVDGADGKKIYYLHDKPKLEDSKYIATIPAPGTYAYTTTGWNKGSPVWQYGHTQDGSAVYQQLYAHKIRGEMLEAGLITSIARRSNGSPVSSWSLDTGRFRTENGEFYGDLYVDSKRYGYRRYNVGEWLDKIEDIAKTADQAASAAKRAADNAYDAASSARSAASSAQQTASNAQQAAQSASQAAGSAKQAADSAALAFRQFLAPVQNEFGYPTARISGLWLASKDGTYHLEVQPQGYSGGVTWSIPLQRLS